MKRIVAESALLKALQLCKLVTLSCRVGAVSAHAHSDHSHKTQPRPCSSNQSDPTTTTPPHNLTNEPRPHSSNLTAEPHPHSSSYRAELRPHSSSHKDEPRPHSSSQSMEQVTVLTLKRELENLVSIWEKQFKESSGRSCSAEGCGMGGAGSSRRWEEVDDVDVWARCCLGVCPGQNVGVDMFDFSVENKELQHQVIEIDSKLCRTDTFGILYFVLCKEANSRCVIDCDVVMSHSLPKVSQTLYEQFGMLWPTCIIAF